MQIAEISPIYADQVAFLEQKAKTPSLWQAEAGQTAKRARGGFATADEGLQILHDMQRLRQVFVPGIENNTGFRAAYDQLKPANWVSFTSPPVVDDLQQSLASLLYNADPAKNDVAILIVANGARRIGEIVLEKCLADHIPTIVDVKDTNFNTLVINHADDRGIEALAKDYLAQTAPVTKRIVARAGMDSGPAVEQDTRKNQLYSKLIKPFMDRIRSGEVFYTLTEIPTEKDAHLDGIAFKDYVTVFFEMIDQPWGPIGKAHENLIKELNAAKTLRFTNDDGTDLTMGINGFTFCNSLVAKNVPGSEVFSGPERESLNGRIVAKGKFISISDRNAVIENLTMEFKDGRLIGWYADKGQEHFEKAISVDDGAKFAGEIGIGTNPHLHRHVMNGLLVEKIGGSFHIALGSAYSYKEYGGKPVIVDNGNRSDIHWDITTQLSGKGGCIYIDGRKAMDNGLWIDAAYDVLNRGWAAVPVAERPAYWKVPRPAVTEESFASPKP